MARVKTDNFIINDDIITRYLYCVNGHTFNVIFTELGAIDEDGEEATGWGGLFEITPGTAQDNHIITAIYNEIAADMYEPEITGGNDFDTYITEPPFELSFINEGSPDDTEAILDNIEKIIDELTA